MTERFVVTSPDGSRDALYERRTALSRDLLGDETSERKASARGGLRGRHRQIKSRVARGDRRIPELALGLVLVVGGAVAATTLAKSRSSMVDVVGVSRAIARGDVLSAEDLTAVEVDARIARSFVSAKDAASVVGRIAAADLESGLPIATGSLARATVLNEGESIVAVRIEVGDVPASIAAGDEVRVAFVPDPSLATETTATEFSTTATVWAVDEPSETIEDYVISLKVPKDFLVASATAQRTKIAIISPSGGSAE